jgi:AraC family transcriptional regulator of adaptative response/methylated-DNA-[protein]-cysteine methyltransferase
MSESEYDRIGRAIEFLVSHERERPSLERVASAVGLSEFHFQRLFQRWTGVSPRQLLAYLTLERARELLRSRTSVLETAVELGLSGPGRLHDLLVTLDAVTPGEQKSLGEGLRIEHGVHESPFGACLIGRTDRGVAWLSFDDGSEEDGVRELAREWPKATLVHAPRATAKIAARIFDTSARTPEPVRLLVHGSNFRIKVWEALIRIPPGTVTSYSALAESIGASGAARAVGQAVGSNAISWIIPCHRVLHELGKKTSYRWGATRKRAMLAWEAARTGAGERSTAARSS